MKVVPKDLDASEISVRIGANWIDIADYNKFLNEYAKANTYLYPVTRTTLGEYKIEGNIKTILLPQIKPTVQTE